jgi:hypothetical protein
VDATDVPLLRGWGSNGTENRVKGFFAQNREISDDHLKTIAKHAFESKNQFQN